MIYLVLGFHTENEVVGNHIEDNRYRNDREHKGPDFECGFYHVVRSRALLILYCIMRIESQIVCQMNCIFIE